MNFGFEGLQHGLGAGIASARAAFEELVQHPREVIADGIIHQVIGPHPFAIAAVEQFKGWNLSQEIDTGDTQAV